MVGTGLTTAFAAIVEFAVLPGVVTFPALVLAIGLVPLPAGTLMTRPWQTAMFTAMADKFHTAARSRESDELRHPAILQRGIGHRRRRGRRCARVSVAAATVAQRCGPGRSWRSRCAICGASRRAPSPGRPTIGKAGSTQPLVPCCRSRPSRCKRAQLLAALSVGSEIIRLRRVARRFCSRRRSRRRAGRHVRRGESAIATERLARLDRALSAPAGCDDGVAGQASSA